MEEAKQVFAEWLAKDGARKLQSDEPIQVPVYFHVITAFNGLLGTVPRSTVTAQIDVLNESFQPYFTFDLVEVDYVDNDDWYDGGLSFQSSTARTDMRSSLRKGGSASLNIYATDTTRSSGGVLLGLATFPSEYENMYVLKVDTLVDSHTTFCLCRPSQDGIIVWSGTLPGGSCGRLCNEGYTAVHEGVYQNCFGQHASPQRVQFCFQWATGLDCTIPFTI